MASSTKYKGSALYVAFLSATRGTVDLTGDSRTVQVQEQAQRLDVTTRGDSAKRFLNETPEITVTINGLDGTGSGSANWLWDTFNSGDSGTLVWGPDGTASSYRKKSLAVRLNTKSFNSPYDNAVEWTHEWASDGGTVVSSTW